MKKIKATPKEFAQHLLNPLSKYDFMSAYGNGLTEEQNVLGHQFAIEAANYSFEQLDGSIISLVMTTQKLMEALNPLTDEHFNLSFDHYIDKVMPKIDPLQESNNVVKEVNNIAFEAFIQVIKDVKRDKVKEFLNKTGYSFIS